MQQKELGGLVPWLILFDHQPYKEKGKGAYAD